MIHYCDERQHYCSRRQYLHACIDPWYADEKHFIDVTYRFFPFGGFAVRLKHISPDYLDLFELTFSRVPLLHIFHIFWRRRLTVWWNMSDLRYFVLMPFYLFRFVSSCVSLRRIFLIRYYYFFLSNLISPCVFLKITKNTTLQIGFIKWLVFYHAPRCRNKTPYCFIPSKIAIQTAKLPPFIVIFSARGVAGMRRVVYAFVSVRNIAIYVDYLLFMDTVSLPGAPFSAPQACCHANAHPSIWMTFW